MSHGISPVSMLPPGRMEGGTRGFWGKPNDCLTDVEHTVPTLLCQPIPFIEFGEPLWIDATAASLPRKGGIKKPLAVAPRYDAKIKSPGAQSAIRGQQHFARRSDQQPSGWKSRVVVKSRPVRELELTSPSTRSQPFESARELASDSIVRRTRSRSASTGIEPVQKHHLQRMHRLSKP